MQPTLENRVETLEIRMSKAEAGLLPHSKDAKLSHQDLTDAIAFSTQKIEKRIDQVEARLANLEAGQQRQEQLLQAILDRLPPKQ
jgi:uncharacterized coiled-coil protein SlyX